LTVPGAFASGGGFFILSKNFIFLKKSKRLVI